MENSKSKKKSKKRSKKPSKKKGKPETVAVRVELISRLKEIMEEMEAKLNQIKAVTLR